MSKILPNLKYAKSHEWVKVEGNTAWIGITDYAQSNLGSIVYVEVHEIDDTVSQFKPCGVIESVKAASDILSPISGVVVDINEAVIDQPELLNEDCYSNWILKVEIEDAAELDALLDEEQYAAECH